METILITGSQGFIGTYFCKELLSHNYKVIGIDNFSKYGRVKRAHDNHKNFKLIEGNVKDLNNLKISEKIDYIIANAAMIGGISYFHKYAYDLLATNERILASTFDFAIDRFKKGELKRIIVISSSMVFENTNSYPTKEEEVKNCPPPSSTYGFQKLASEYFCKGAWEQYQLPYTIVRPFNCVGVGEEESLNKDEMTVGNVKMMMSHVLPDLVNRALQSGKDNPLPILGSGDQIRHYTNGKDIARALRIIIENEKAINENFNISNEKSTSVKELAQVIWKELYNDAPLSFIHETPFEYDVQKRIPDVSKAKNMLGIVCDTPLEESVKEVIKWMRFKIDK